MIIYNVTININHESHDEWLMWMRERHIPDVMATGLFTEQRMLRLLGDEDSGGVTYAIQYTCRTLADYETYRDHHASPLQKEALQKFGDRFTAFRTLLEIV